jgi:LacI family transcriptional regulator
MAFFGIDGLAWSNDRQMRFRRFAEDLGADFYSFLLKGDEADVLSHNFNELTTWLKQLPKPIDILCCNDDFGQILINSCSLAGLKIPHEIAVLGIDNDELICNICYPNLSSIARNHQNTAHTICGMLDEMMNGIEHKGEIIVAEALEIIERSSTDTIATTDRDVSAAISYISGNLHKPIDVNAVARFSKLSVKALNKKFKLATSNTVYEEIQLRKLGRFKQLLLANKSVKEIAFELAFPDPSHVSRWFSNLEGTTPIEWKKKVF